MYQVTATMEDGSKIPYSAMDEFQMCHIYYMLMNKEGVISKKTAIEYSQNRDLMIKKIGML